MAFTAGDVIKDCYEYWNGPAETDLRQSVVIKIINRKVNRLLLKLQLSDKNYLAVLSEPFSFNGSERTVSLTSLDDLSAVVRVESRSSGDTNDDNWSEEVISDYGSWNDSLLSRLDSVAFYGSSPDNLTMAVNRDASGLEFRILYETGGVNLTAFNDSVPVFQDFFRSTIFYGVAAEAGIMLDGLNAEGEASRDKKVGYAQMQEDMAIRDFKEWLLNDPGQAIAYRQAFNDSRLGSGRVRMLAENGIGGYFSRY